MTDDSNHHFSERDTYRTIFEVKRHTIISSRDKSIKHINLGYVCNSVKGNAFADMVELESVVMADYLSSVGENAFAGCRALRTVQIGPLYCGTSMIKAKHPEHSWINASNIGKSAFVNCSSLQAVYLDVHTLQPKAFEGCTDLKAVEIADFQATIGSGAFADCTALRDVYFEDNRHGTIYGSKQMSIAAGAFKGCKDLIFHVYKNTVAHQFALKNGINSEIISRFPKTYRVNDKNSVKRKRRISDLHVGDKVFLQYAENGKDPLAFNVLDAQGGDLGFFSVWNMLEKDEICDASNGLTARVSSMQSSGGATALSVTISNEP